MSEVNKPNREKLNVAETPGSTQREKSERERESLREHSQELAQGIEGVVEGIEDAEGMSTGEVSEKSGEGKKKASGSSGTTTTEDTVTSSSTQDEPPFEVMVIQIRTKLKQEIAVLQKEAKKLQKPSNFSPYQFSLIMQKIRSLRAILAELLTAAGEKVKELWKEYVKGT